MDSVKKMTLTEATEILQQQKVENLNQCQAEIQQILEKYGATLVPVVKIVGHKIVSEIEIVLK